MMDWVELTDRSLRELAECDPGFRPTSFWGPGLDRLLSDLRSRGLDSFKAWPSAGFWFYPRYGAGMTYALVDSVLEHLRVVRPGLNEVWLRNALVAAHEARRDFDVFRLAWDHSRWPVDLEGKGESQLGGPVQYFRFTGADHGWTKPYLNYGLCLAALSRHVEAPPRRFLEIGGGFGSLGEFVLSHDPKADYVNVDIPPLLTVASYYLRGLFGERVSVYDARVPSTGPLDIAGSAVLPNYRLPDIEGPFDVFVNTFSFQEMEPHVVEHYVDAVVEKDVRYVVSLNSRDGKPRLADGHQVGVVEPVTSAAIAAMFERRGYETLARHDSPLINSAGQLVVLGQRPARIRRRLRRHW